MIEIGPFAIFGDWDDSPTPDGKIRISIPPLGHIFGAGWMPHTQSGLLAVHEHMRPGMSFLEVGAGSGILCVAAAKMGASRCIATELDRDALAILPKMFEANGVAVEIVDGTFVDDRVDLAVVSISSEFWEQNRQKVEARKVIVVHDDASTEVVE